MLGPLSPSCLFLCLLSFSFLALPLFLFSVSLTATPSLSPTRAHRCSLPFSLFLPLLFLPANISCFLVVSLSLSLSPRSSCRDGPRNTTNLYYRFIRYSLKTVAKLFRTSSTLFGRHRMVFANCHVEEWTFNSHKHRPASENCDAKKGCLTQKGFMQLYEQVRLVRRLLLSLCCTPTATRYHCIGHY